MASYKEFTQMIDQARQEIEPQATKAGSLESYVHNHLVKLSSNCDRSAKASEVSNSVKALVRFSVDSLEWGSDLLEKISQISEYHSNLLKAEQRNAL